MYQKIHPFFVFQPDKNKHRIMPFAIKTLLFGVSQAKGIKLFRQQQRLEIIKLSWNRHNLSFSAHKSSQPVR